MPSSWSRSVVFSWKTRNWKILPLDPTAWTVMGRCRRLWGSVWNRDVEMKSLQCCQLRPAGWLPSSPRKVCAPEPKHSQRRTWTSWPWTGPAWASIEGPLIPGNKACEREDKGSRLWTLLEGGKGNAVRPESGPAVWVYQVNGRKRSPVQFISL